MTRRIQRAGRGGEPDDRFFHRRHIVTTFWALVAAAVTYAVTRVVSDPSQPQPVLVVNQDTTIRVVAVGDTAVSRQLRELLSAWQTSISRTARSPRTALPQQAGSVTPPSDREPRHSEILIDPYRFPRSPEGFVASDLRLLANTECPKAPIPPELTIDLVVRFLDPATVARVTPLFLRLGVRESPTRIQSVLGGQFEVFPHFVVSLPTPPVKARYELEYGVYARSDTLYKFPTFHRMICPIDLS